MWQLETRIAQVETGGELAADDVVIRAEPAQSLLSTGAVLPSFAAARELIGQIARAARKSLRPAACGPLLVIAHAPEFEPDRLDVEIGYIVRGATAERLAAGGFESRRSAVAQ